MIGIGNTDSRDTMIIVVVIAILVFLYFNNRQKQTYFVRNSQGQYEIPNLGVKLNYGSPN